MKLLILSTLAWMGYVILSFQSVRETVSEGYISSPKVKAAMKYHGINNSYEINGKHYFKRNGRRVELFTKNFELHYNIIYGGE